MRAVRSGLSHGIWIGGRQYFSGNAEHIKDYCGEMEKYCNLINNENTVTLNCQGGASLSVLILLSTTYTENIDLFFLTGNIASS